MKNCPLSSEGKFFEDHGCLFANLAAYYLGDILKSCRVFTSFAGYLLRRIFFENLALFALFRRLPLRGIIFLTFSGCAFEKKSVTNIRKARKIFPKSQQRIVRGYENNL